MTESIKSQTNEEVKYEEATRFEERYRALGRNIVQKFDSAAAACKQVEDEAAATNEHPEGHNKVTAAADKRDE